jgi:hypothetical protein
MPVMHENLRLTESAVQHGRCERTHSGAQMTALTVDVIQDIVSAGSADHFICGKSGNPLRRFVPVGDYPLAIDEIQTIIEVIKNIFIRFFLKIHQNIPS